MLQLGIAKPGEPTLALPAAHPDAKRNVAAYYYWLFPTTMFNVYPWGISQRRNAALSGSHASLVSSVRLG